MRAVVANEQNRFDVRDVDDPRPGPGNILVRVAACGICGSDLHMMEAKIAKRVSLVDTDEAFFGLLAGAAEGKVLVTP